MEKTKILSIVFGVIAFLALFSELEKYSQAAALSVNRTEKSLLELSC